VIDLEVCSVFIVNPILIYRVVQFFGIQRLPSDPKVSALEIQEAYAALIDPTDVARSHAQGDPKGHYHIEQVSPAFRIRGSHGNSWQE